jgi:hydrogenase-4 component B
VVARLTAVTTQFGLPALADTSAPWWMLVPLADREASYAPTVFLVAVAVVVVLAIVAVRMLYHRSVRRAPPWDCGFGNLDARMQDTAEGFGQPIRHIFQPFFSMRRELPTPFDRAPRYSVRAGDRIWQTCYAPLRGIVQRIADSFAWIQQGRISVYLLYSFVTLVVLLALVI